MSLSTVAQLRPKIASKKPPKSEPLIAPTGIMTVDAVADVVNRTVDPFVTAPPPEQGTVGAVSHYLNASLGMVGAPFEMLDAGFAMATSSIAALFPGMPAATLLMPHLGMPHGHSHPPSLIPPAPPVPLPSIGTVLGAGSVSVLVGGVPAARASDVGLAVTCGSLSPAFEIYTGSSNVFIGGSRAARIFDITRHCNPASAMGTFGKAMAAAGVVAGGLSAAAQDAGGAAAAAAMAAAQAAADAAALAMSALLGKDPGLPPAMGAVMLGNPLVLVGGFPMPDVLELIGGLMKAVKKLKKAARKPKAKVKKTKCNDPSEPVELATGVVYNDFEDFIEPGGLRWVRHYRSEWADDIGPLGPGFRHFYERRLTLHRTRAVLHDWNGETFEFDRADGRYAGTAGGWVLEQPQEQMFVARRGDVALHLERIGDEAQLVRWVEGNRDLHLLRGQNGQLARISDHRPAGVVDLYFHWDRDRIVLVEYGWRGHARNAIARYEYDAAGQLERYYDALTNVEHYVYDGGRMVRYINRNRYEFRWRYDSEGRCVVAQGIDGLWRATMRYEPGRTFVEKANGGQWIYTYDENQVLRAVVDPYGNALLYQVDDDGRIASERLPGGEVVRWLYTDEGELVGRMDQFGTVYPPLDEDPDPPEIVARLPPENPFEFLFGPRFAELGEPALLPVPASIQAQLRDVFGRATAANAVARPPTYDLLGRVIAEHDPSGATRHYQRDAEGNVVVEVDLDGRAWTAGFESWNLRTGTRDPVGNITRYKFDAHEEIATLVDPNSAVTQFEHDLRDRLSRIVRHGAQHERYQYDRGDHLLAKIGPDEEILVSYIVGPNGLHSALETATKQRHEFEYDQWGNPIAARGPDAELQLEWDSDERRELDLRDGQGVRHRRATDDWWSTVYFERFAVEYRDFGDGDWRVFTPGRIEHCFRRTQTGYTLAELGNGARVLSHFDHQGWCSGAIEWHGDGPDSQARWSVGYRHTAEGELQHVLDSSRGHTEYGYDAAHRLVLEEASGLSRSYAYDRAGNLLSTPRFPDLRYAEGNRLGAIGGAAVTHDARQRMATRERGDASTVHYEYDDLDQLVRVWWDGKGEEWRAGYDSLNRRVFKEFGGKRWEYWWDGDRLAAELRPDGVLRIYIYVNDEALVPFMFVDYDGMDADLESGRNYYVFTNQVGVPVQVEDHAGEIVWWAEHVEPYGGVLVRPGLPLELDLRFPGHYYDAETGLHYNRFRYYDPELGRYIQPDPEGIAGSVNLYAYPANPLTDVDVDGLHPPKKGSKPARKKKKKGKPGSESTSPQKKQQKKKKPLSEMTQAELEAHATALANKLNKKYVGKGRDANTFCVTVVQKKGKPGTRKLVVTSNLNHQNPPKKLQRMLKANGAEWRNNGPHLTKTRPKLDANGNRVHTKPKKVRGKGGKVTTKPGRPVSERAPKGEFYERRSKPDGSEEHVPYRKKNQDFPDGESRHHAEQRMTKALGKDEEAVVVAPSRKCCDGCRAALKKSKLIDKVPESLRGE
jgi:RHS repeat-associated protein